MALAKAGPNKGPLFCQLDPGRTTLVDQDVSSTESCGAACQYSDDLNTGLDRVGCGVSWPRSNAEDCEECYLAYMNARYVHLINAIGNCWLIVPCIAMPCA